MQVRLLWHRTLGGLRIPERCRWVWEVGNLFAAHRSTIITLYNGAFDSSAAVFFIIKVQPLRSIQTAPSSRHQTHGFFVAF